MTRHRTRRAAAGDLDMDAHRRLVAELPARLIAAVAGGVLSADDVAQLVARAKGLLDERHAAPDVNVVVR